MRRHKFYAVLATVLVSGCLATEDSKENITLSASVPTDDVTQALEANYRVSGNIPEGGDGSSDIVVFYKMQNERLEARDKGGNLIFEAILDSSTGLLRWIRASQPNSLSDLRFSRDPQVEVQASVGVPLLGAYVSNRFVFPLNPVPPPNWLSSSNSKNVLGRHLEVQRNNTDVAIEPCPYCFKLQLNVTESWTADHPIFPARHELRGHGWSFQMVRLTPLENLPHESQASEPASVGLSPVPRSDWHAYPPMGDNDAASQFHSFITQVDADNEDVDLVSRRDYVSIFTVSARPTSGPAGTPLWEISDVEAHARVLNQDGLIIDFQGTRKRVADTLTPTGWDIRRYDAFRGERHIFHEVSDHPALISLEDMMANSNVTIRDVVNVFGTPSTFAEDPAFSYVLVTYTCSDGGYVLREYSFWSGALAMTKSGKAECASDTGSTRYGQPFALVWSLDTFS